jgi:hypothetical protein
MDYDYLQAVEKRYNRMYSYGGIVEKSFWQNVGKIVNKKEKLEQTKMFDEMLKTADKIIKGGMDDRSRI